MNLGELITEKREDLGYRKVEFSKIIGVGYDTLRDWEMGGSIPTGKNMRRLVEVLEFTPQEIELYF